MSLSSLIVGVAGLINDAGLGVYDENTVIDPSDWVVVLGGLPQTPDRVIALTPYRVQSNAKVPTDIGAFQVRCRASGEDIRTVTDKSAEVFNLIQGAEPGLMTDLFVSLIWWQNGAPMGQDENRRWEYADSYYARLDYPSSHRDR